MTEATDGDDGPDVPDGPDGPDEVLDARGLRCPLPVIRLATLVRDDPTPRVITVLATDPAAAHDIPAWCRMRGHAFVGTRNEADDSWAHIVQVLPPGAARAST